MGPVRPLVRYATILVFTGSMLLFSLMAALFFGISADDAYIVSRYARNFNAGYGIVFNQGERINAFIATAFFCPGFASKHINLGG